MNILKLGMVLLSFVTLWGCSKGNSGAPVTIDPVTKKHQTGWVAAGTGGSHPVSYLANPASCESCHGAITDLSGGISKVSCSGGGTRNGIQCHATFPHVAGFAVPSAHGAKAKLPKDYGFVLCINCHGADFNGKGTAPSCLVCHGVAAPHAAAPWRGAPRTHVNTDPSNAVVCATCHTNGAHTPLAHLDGVLDGVAHTPITAANPAGCFNNTLCHAVVGHANDPQPWTAPANHGARAKTDLSGCRDCHATGTNPPVFTVAKTNIPNGCETCHTKPGLAHPYIWLADPSAGRITTHATITTTAINACKMCHGPNLNDPYPGIPSCFGAYPNNSPAGVAFKCHATTPAIDTKCISCHGGTSTGPNGASFPNTANAHPKHTALTGVSCFTCHNNAGSGTPQHATLTAAVVSLLPAQAGAGAAYNPTTKTCANVSCHIGTTPAWSTTVSSGCATCHTAPLAGASGRHTKHWDAISNLQCDSCHVNAATSGTHTTNPIVVGTPLPAKYNENGAVASYDPITGVCSNVVCHGGIVFRQNTQIFPAWRSLDTFDRTQCSHCHNILGAGGGEAGQTPDTYTGPYIGPFSGYGGGGVGANNLHVAHLFIAANTGTPPSQVCQLCHVVTGLPHYGNIVNGRGDLVPGFAAGTIKGSGILTYTFTGGITPSGTCTTIAGQPGVGGCHFDAPAVRDWFNKSNP